MCVHLQQNREKGRQEKKTARKIWIDESTTGKAVGSRGGAQNVRTNLVRTVHRFRLAEKQAAAPGTDAKARRGGPAERDSDLRANTVQINEPTATFSFSSYK